MKLGAVAAGLVLVLGGVVGCGDGPGTKAEDAPSVEEFCSALTTFRDTVAKLDSSNVAGYAKALRAAADALGKVGTPDGIPDDARDGFDLTIDRIDGLPDEATREDLGSLGDVDDAGQKRFDALETYIHRSCPDLTGITSPAAPESSGS